MKASPGNAFELRTPHVAALQKLRASPSSLHPLRDHCHSSPKHPRHSGPSDHPQDTLVSPSRLERPRESTSLVSPCSYALHDDLRHHFLPSHHPHSSQNYKTALFGVTQQTLGELNASPNHPVTLDHPTSPRSPPLPPNPLEDNTRFSV